MDEFSFDIGDIASEMSNYDFGNLNYDALLDDGFSFDISNLAEEVAGLSPDALRDVGGALDLGSYQDVDAATLESMLAEGDIGGFPNELNREGIFNAARDSQKYNETLTKEAALAGYGAPGATPGRVQIGDKTYSSTGAPTTTPKRTNTTGTNRIPGTSRSKSLLETLMPLLLAALVTKRKGSGINTQPVLPKLTAEQRQTPYTQMQQAPGYRPGQGGVRYFEPLTYTQRMAGGGIIDLAKALAAKRREQRKGLLQGRGDGVSDSIPATIDGERPARLARGEYVVDARTVAELGNGSTDAGAERLDEMRKRVLQKRKKAKVGQDSKARQDLPE